MEIEQDLMFCYRFMTRQRPVTDVVKFTNKMVGAINTSMDTCGYTGSIKMLQDFCRQHYTPSAMLVDVTLGEEESAISKARCSESTLIRNFYTRIFSHMASYQRVAELCTELWY